MSEESKTPPPIMADPLRYVDAQGSTLKEMRDNVRETGLYRFGDARLVWVNEGDLITHSIFPAAIFPEVSP